MLSCCKTTGCLSCTSGSAEQYFPSTIQGISPSSVKEVESSIDPAVTWGILRCLLSWKSVLHDIIAQADALCLPYILYVTFWADFSIAGSLNAAAFKCHASGLTEFSLESNKPNLIWFAPACTGAELFPFSFNGLHWSHFIIITTAVSGCLLIRKASTSIWHLQVELTMHISVQPQTPTSSQRMVLSSWHWGCWDILKTTTPLLSCKSSSLLRYVSAPPWARDA